MAHGIARIRLDDGTPVWARVSDAEELGRGGGFQDTGVRDRVVSMAGGLTDVVRGVVGSLRAGLDPQGPVEVAVSFGIELSAQSGKVIGVLADGAGKASVNVSLTWTEPGPTAVAGPTGAAGPTAVAGPEAAPDATEGSGPAAAGVTDGRGNDATSVPPAPGPPPPVAPPLPPAPPVPSARPAADEIA
ncbi:CU044_2847 family protein [Streptomyces sp. NPDC090082]|uniref:CU044_2847 family protein n=1 Tax=unclassified Streptomyces TaxID=2593676 RepID=UPI003812E58F